MILRCAVVVAVVGLGACTSQTSTAPATAGSPTSVAPDTSPPATPETAVSAATELIAATEPTTADTTTAESAVLFDFDDQSGAAGWGTVDDRVMGGVSLSTVTWQSSELVFAGDVSTDNNGGFSSALSAPDERLGLISQEATGLRLSAVGDGKTYIIQLRLGDGGRSSYIQRFATQAGVPANYDFAFADFVPVSFMLEPLSGVGPIDPNQIAQIGFYILDKQVGPFSLRMSSIETISQLS